MSTLTLHTAGQGPDIIVLHGWGMSRHIWQPVQAALEARFTVHWLDLPGHGDNQHVPMQSLRDFADQLANLVPQPAYVLGWSLGGLFAQYYAMAYPKQVKGLQLVASSPCFIQKDGWQAAMPAALLDQFAEGLQSDWAGTLNRFLALQFMGVKGVQADVKSIKQQISKHPPHPDALNQGLHLLKHVDLRLLPVRQPRQWLFGRLDRIVPVELVDALEGQDCQVIANAGHAPFISHPNEFVDWMSKVTQA